MLDLIIKVEEDGSERIIEKVSDEALRDTMLSLLKKSRMLITFTKTDGSERVLNGTLVPEWIPKTGYAKKPIKENDEVIRCFDLDAAEYRSFRVRSVKLFEVKEMVAGALEDE